jgi:hypothetical protein
MIMNTMGRGNSMGSGKNAWCWERIDWRSGCTEGVHEMSQLENINKDKSTNLLPAAKLAICTQNMIIFLQRLLHTQYLVKAFPTTRVCQY